MQRCFEWKSLLGASTRMLAHEIEVGEAPAAQQPQYFVGMLHPMARGLGQQIRIHRLGILGHLGKHRTLQLPGDSGSIARGTANRRRQGRALRESAQGIGQRFGVVVGHETDCRPCTIESADFHDILPDVRR